MSGRGTARLEAFAHALAMGADPTEAAQCAGYPQGSSFKANARKRAQRDDVKAIAESLRRPVIAKAVEANFEWAFNYHRQIVEAGLNNPDNKATIAEAQRSLDAMAKLMGWYKPDKVETTLHAGFADSLDRAFAAVKAERARVRE